MWAQLISTRIKPDKAGEVPRLMEEIRKVESSHSGFVRATLMQDQNDPSRMFTLVVFESEAKARARENDPQRQKDLEGARALMEEIYDGAPEFVDLNVLEESLP